VSLSDPERFASITESSPEERTGSRITLWLTRTSAHFAADLVERLRDMNVQVQLLDDHLSGATSLATQIVAYLDSRSAQPRLDREGPILRGGLAPGALRRVRDYIELAIAQKLESKDLAKLAGLSDCHFSRAFRQSLGVPPHRYVMTRRVAIAARLIQQTERSLTEIALEVGFSDQSHFTRIFTRMKGETPGLYRRRHR
jgi:transcriptional regulator GlxA family with amidase domain